MFKWIGKTFKSSQAEDDFYLAADTENTSNDPPPSKKKEQRTGRNHGVDIKVGHLSVIAPKAPTLNLGRRLIPSRERMMRVEKRRVDHETMELRRKQIAQMVQERRVVMKALLEKQREVEIEEQKRQRQMDKELRAWLADHSKLALENGHQRLLGLMNRKQQPSISDEHARLLQSMSDVTLKLQDEQHEMLEQKMHIMSLLTQATEWKSNHREKWHQQTENLNVLTMKSMEERHQKLIIRQQQDINVSRSEEKKLRKRKRDAKPMENNERAQERERLRDEKMKIRRERQLEFEEQLQRREAEIANMSKAIEEERRNVAQKSKLRREQELKRESEHQELMEKESQRIALEKQRLLEEQELRITKIKADAEERLQAHRRLIEEEERKRQQQEQDIREKVLQVENIEDSDNDGDDDTFEQNNMEEPGTTFEDESMDMDTPIQVPDILQPIVIDLGTQFLRVGFAGNEKSALMLPNLVGRMNLSRIGAVAIDIFQNDNKHELLMPDEITQLTNLIYKKAVSLSKPVKAGAIDSSDDLKSLFEYVLFQHLGVLLEEQPVLLTYSVRMDHPMKRDLLSMFIYDFNACAVSMAPQLCCALSDPMIPSSSTTGLVIEVGQDLSQCVAVFEGYAIESSACASRVATGDNLFQVGIVEQNSLVLSNGHTFQETCFEFLRQRICEISSDGSDVSLARQGRRLSEFEQRFEFPDGNSCHMSMRGRRQLGELLFRPDVFGSATHLNGLKQSEDCDKKSELTFGLHQIALQALSSLAGEKELILAMLSNVVIVGDCADIKGLKQRMEFELLQAFPETTINIKCIPEPGASIYRGASSLANSQEFDSRCITHTLVENYGCEIADQMAI